MTIAAFFDVDGTLYRNSLMIEHFKKLVKYEVFDPIIWHSDIKQAFHEWKRREGDYDNYMEDLAEVYIKNLKGLNKNEYDFIANQVINLCGDRVYSYTRNQIKYHQNMGHKVFFISGSPDYLVEKMAEKYDVNDFKASTYKTDKNYNFTGEVVPMWDSDSKIKSIYGLTKKHNIDLNKSYAYGDTHGDLSMLKIVENPVAINPSYELLKSLRNNKKLSNTKIIIERKDVIYQTDPSIQFNKGGI